ncbi:hypothetical protein [Streptomyces sp. NBC_01237]|uniref:hypothetical protein n=1 Tax=Streptomyces sp. NBC_01237 TaxID=2903790 RepID=UPI002DDC396D|nr:hypothetical protein [Streptomyces sp. NBC_01237]WRZ72890.1 hypothetical protein OG251_15335 [Streptomyces sp. NBC_01237]
MFLVLHREGESEPTRWRYEPKKLMSVEREDIERRTGRHFAQFTQDVLQGNSLCRRALLFTYLRRDHPKTRFEDVDFGWDELTLEYSRQEYATMRESILGSLHGDELAMALQQIDRDAADAYDDIEATGKVQLPIAG